MIQMLANEINVPTEIKDENAEKSSAAVANFIASQDPYLGNNWAAILATTSKEYLRYIMITSEVVELPEGITEVKTANITNEEILIRVPFQGVAMNGVYSLSRTPKKMPSRSHWVGFPNVEVAKPDFNLIKVQYPKLVESMRMPQDACGSFATFCEQVRHREGVVVIDKQGAYMKQDPTYAWMYPFGLLQPTTVNPRPLVFAFKEAQRYKDGVFVVRQYDEQRAMPLFVGLDWFRCAMVSTLKAHQYLGYE